MELITLEYHEVIDKKVVSKELQFSKELLQNPYNLNSLSVIKVEGESMQPMILDGALVVVDISQKQIEHSAIYILEHGDKMWIKRAHIEKNETIFISINEAFKHLVYKEKEVRIIAKALLTFTNL